MHRAAATRALEIWKSPGRGRRSRRLRPPNSRSSVEARPSRTTAASRIASPFAPTETDGEAARPRGLDHARGDLGVGVDDRGRAGRQEVAEQPELGGEIILDRRVIIHVVAAEIGEGAGGEPHAVEPLLVEPVRGRLHREMSDARLGERLQRSVERHRIRRGQRAVDRDRPRNDADRAERRGFPADRRPDLADEGGDRGLAAGAGDRDDRLGLARIKPRRGPRQRQAGVGDLDERRAFGRRRRARRRSRSPRAEARRQRVSVRRPSPRRARRRRRPARPCGCRRRRRRRAGPRARRPLPSIPRCRRAESCRRVYSLPILSASAP